MKVEVPVPADPVVPDPNKQSVVSVAYLMVNQIKEKEAELENFALTVASDLLLNGPQAYFHETLLESGLGSGIRPGDRILVVQEGNVVRGGSEGRGRGGRDRGGGQDPGHAGEDREGGLPQGARRRGHAPG